MKDRRLAVIALAISLVVAATAAGREPLLYLAALGGITYLVAKIAFDLTQPRTQRRVRILAIGGGATFLTGGLVWTVSYWAISSETRAWLDSDIWYIVLILVAFAVIATCMWIEFYRAFKNRESNRNTA